MTIRRPHITPQPSAAKAAWQALGSPQVLLTAVVVAAPFFNASFVPVSTVNAAPIFVHQRNPNIYTNPIPFSQTSWPSVSPVQQTKPRIARFNSELFLNPIPFNNTIWGGSNPFLDNASLSPAVQSYNVNLYSTTSLSPFYQNVWPPAQPIQPLPPPPPPVVNYAGMYSAPFAQLVWNGGSPVNIVPPFVQPFNPGLYPNPFPFAQYVWLAASPIVSKASDVYQPYGNFYGTVAVTAPFYQSAWPAVQPIKTIPADVYQPWANFYSPPFYQTAWPSTQAIKPVVSQPTPYNAQLYTNPIPFAQYVWPSVTPIAPKSADVYQLWQNFYVTVAVSAPFYQSAWPSVSPVKPVASQPTPYNAQLYTNPIPFAQYVWPSVSSIAPKAADVYQPYGNFYASIVIAAPFYQNNWAAASPLRTIPGDVYQPWVNFYSVVVAPFAQYQWPQVQPVKAAPPQLISISYYADFYSSPFNQSSWVQVTRPLATSTLAFSYNAPLYLVLPLPFNASYWPAAQAIRSAPPQATPFNSQLYTNPIPFAQYSWLPVRAVKLAPPFAQPVLAFSTVVYASNRIANAPAEYHLTGAAAENRIVTLNARLNSAASPEVRVAVTYSENRVADAPKKDI